MNAVKAQLSLPPWRRAVREAVRDSSELCRLLELPAELAVRAARASEAFPLFVPRAFLARMRKGDAGDPLLRQVLPLAEEMAEVAGFSADPVAERQAEIAPGLLRKYAGRALLVTTGVCAVHCRYCFRRHYPYDEAPHSLAAWGPAMAQLERDETIHEVLLSGGDPLMLVDETLAALAARLAAIPHLRRLRVHTRLPIVIPERVCQDLLDWLCGTRLTSIVVVHANHPAEIDAAVGAALARLVEAGVPVLNQAVLLRDVNDDADVLAELCERLVELRVLPYYLHQLDRVAGAAHFEVSEAAGLRLMDDLRRRLPGYAVPRYVRETPGAAWKVELSG